MERRGVPTVTLAHDVFERAAHAQAKVMGAPDLPIAVVSQLIYNRGTDEEVKKAADALYPLVVKSLTSGVAKPLPQR